MSEKKGSGKRGVAPKAPKSTSSVEYDDVPAGVDLAESATKFHPIEFGHSFRKLKQGSIHTIQCLAQTSEFESSLTATIEKAGHVAERADEMVKENEDLANAVKLLEKEITSLRETNAQLEGEVKELRTTLEERDGQIDAANNEIIECKNEIESWKKRFEESNQNWMDSWSLHHQEKQKALEKLPPIEAETTREIRSLKELIETIRKIPTTEMRTTRTPGAFIEYKPLEIPKILQDYGRPPQNEDRNIERYEKIMASLEESRLRYQENINQFKEFTHKLNEKYDEVDMSMRVSIDRNHEFSQGVLQLNHKMDELTDQMNASLEDVNELDSWRLHRFCFATSCSPPPFRGEAQGGISERERLMHVRSQVVAILQEARKPAN